MNERGLRNRLVEDYASYTRSFIKIADPRIFQSWNPQSTGKFCRSPMVQLNPNVFCRGAMIDEPCNRWHASSWSALRSSESKKSDVDQTGKPLLMHTHQKEAILKARKGVEEVCMGS